MPPEEMPSEDTVGRWLSPRQGGVLPENNPVRTLVLDFQPPELSEPPSLWHFVMAA